MTIILNRNKHMNFILIVCHTQFQPSDLFVGSYANSAELEQTPFAASDQGLHCLLTECPIYITIQHP